MITMQKSLLQKFQTQSEPERVQLALNDLDVGDSPVKMSCSDRSTVDLLRACTKKSMKYPIKPFLLSSLFFQFVAEGKAGVWLKL